MDERLFKTFDQVDLDCGGCFEVDCLGVRRRFSTCVCSVSACPA